MANFVEAICDFIPQFCWPTRPTALDLPLPPNFQKRLEALERTVEANEGLITPDIVLEFAEAAREHGLSELAVAACRAIPRLVVMTDAASTKVLARALLIQARSLHKPDQAAEADATFRIAEHLHTLAGQLAR